MPYQTNSFVGRKAQLAAIQKKLSAPQVRLLSLTGAGGIGKTRLALQVMAGLANEFEHGMFFIGLMLVQKDVMLQQFGHNRLFAFGVELHQKELSSVG